MFGLIRSSAVKMLGVRMWSTSKISYAMKPSNFDKKILVWTGKYKNADEIPPTISSDVMEKARSKFRIKYANYGLLLTVAVCAYMIYQGKKAAERGESVHQMNMDWHAEVNKEMEVSEKKK